MFSGSDSLFLVASITRYTNCYSFTYPGGMEGWVGLSTMSVNNLLKVITRKRSWWDSNPRPLITRPSPYHCATEPLWSLRCTAVQWLNWVVSVICVVGGFLEFQATHPSLCQSQTACSMSAASGYKCPPLTSMSQPCLPVSNVGPTKILPFLFLGSQQDALSQETMQVSCCLLGPYA